VKTVDKDGNHGSCAHRLATFELLGAASKTVFTGKTELAKADGREEQISIHENLDDASISSPLSAPGPGPRRTRRKMIPPAERCSSSPRTGRRDCATDAPWPPWNCWRPPAIRLAN
jgi:hypothetical protein